MFREELLPQAARGKFFGAGAEARLAVDRPGHYEQRGLPDILAIMSTQSDADSF